MQLPIVSSGVQICFMDSRSERNEPSLDFEVSMEVDSPLVSVKKNHACIK